MGRIRSSASSPSPTSRSEASPQKQSQSKAPATPLRAPKISRNELLLGAADAEMRILKSLVNHTPTLPQLIITKSPTKQAEMHGQLLAAQEQIQITTRAIETIKTNHLATELLPTVHAFEKELREIRDKNDTLIIRSNLLQGRTVKGLSDPPVLPRASEHEVATQLVNFRNAFWEGLYSIPKVQRERVNDISLYEGGKGRSQHVIFSLKKDEETPADLRKRIKKVLGKIDAVRGTRTLPSLSVAERSKVAKVLLTMPAPPEHNVRFLSECKADQALLTTLEAKILCKHSSVIAAAAKKVPSAIECRTLQRELGGTALQIHETIARLSSLAESYLALKDYLVACNKWIVCSIVARSPKLNRYPEDLVQEGTIGLMRAIEKYDPSSGFKLGTYATFWIKQTTGRSYNSVSRLVDIPSNAIAPFEELRTTIGEPGALTDYPSLARRTGLSERDLQNLIPLARPIQSLQSPAPHDQSRQIGFLIPDPKAVDAENVAIESEARSIVLESLRHLHPRLREVILLRFGLDGNQPLTLLEVGEKLNLTRERIRQIQQQGLEKLLQLSRRPDSKLGSLASVFGFEL